MRRKTFWFSAEKTIQAFLPYESYSREYPALAFHTNRWLYSLSEVWTPSSAGVAVAVPVSGRSGSGIVIVSVGHVGWTSVGFIKRTLTGAFSGMPPFSMAAVVCTVENVYVIGAISEDFESAFWSVMPL